MSVPPDVKLLAWKFGWEPRASAMPVDNFAFYFRAQYRGPISVWQCLRGNACVVTAALDNICVGTGLRPVQGGRSPPLF
jgi:hypothetical protein